MTLRIRYCFGLKELPYKTVWVEYPDIEPTLRDLGAPPAGKIPGGGTYYTLPAISDPNNLNAEGKPTIVVDSEVIAAYLDEHYPTEKSLLSADTKEAQHKIISKFMQAVVYPSGSMYLPLFFAILNEKSRPYFRSTRESFLKQPLEEVCTEGSEEREAVWKAIRNGLSEVAVSLDENKVDGVFVLGREPCFADCVLSSAFHMMALFTPKDWEERVFNWDGGRWNKHYEACADWLAF